jgi:hypothetical protein
MDERVGGDWCSNASGGSDSPSSQLAQCRTELSLLRKKLKEKDTQIHGLMEELTIAQQLVEESHIERRPFTDRESGLRRGEFETASHRFNQEQFISSLK